ncbi:MAG: DUF362 domain-containing protein [Candidatus Coatesbacteria bacterium]|nr:MAG: DUF362 domain-containing protein [Candidatus Coatesbacteria bacterium]
MKTRVFIEKCRDYEIVGANVRSLLEKLGADIHGKRILIKPNVLGPFPPDRHVCTRPEVVREVCLALEELGADRVVVGDNPGTTGYGASEKTLRAAGIYDAVNERFVNLAEETEVVAMEVVPGFEIPVAREVIDADVVVNLPKFKTHSQTRITGAVKNAYGYVVGGAKARLHAAAPAPHHFGAACLEIYRLRPPEINIMDAVVGMEGDGPSSKDLRDVGLMLASVNGAALDSVVARLMGMDGRFVPTVRISRELGLCPGDADIDVDGPAEPVPDFRPPSTFMRNRIIYWLTNKLVFPQVVPKPYIDEGICVECDQCVEVCPVDALDGFPSVNYDLCIRCYCCREVCPEAAIKLRGRFKLAVRRGAYIRDGLS